MNRHGCVGERHAGQAYGDGGNHRGGRRGCLLVDMRTAGEQERQCENGEQTRETTRRGCGRDRGGRDHGRGERAAARSRAAAAVNRRWPVMMRLSSARVSSARASRKVSWLTRPSRSRWATRSKARMAASRRRSAACSPRWWRRRCSVACRTARQAAAGCPPAAARAGAGPDEPAGSRSDARVHPRD